MVEAGAGGCEVGSVAGPADWLECDEVRAVGSVGKRMRQYWRNPPDQRFHAEESLSIVSVHMRSGRTWTESPVSSAMKRLRTSVLAVEGSQRERLAHNPDHAARRSAHFAASRAAHHPIRDSTPRGRARDAPEHLVGKLGLGESAHRSVAGFCSNRLWWPTLCAAKTAPRRSPAGNLARNGSRSLIARPLMAITR